MSNASTSQATLAAPSASSIPVQPATAMAARAQQPGSATTMQAAEGAAAAQGQGADASRGSAASPLSRLTQQTLSLCTVGTHATVAGATIANAIVAGASGADASGADETDAGVCGTQASHAQATTQRVAGSQAAATQAGARQQQQVQGAELIGGWAGLAPSAVAGRTSTHAQGKDSGRAMMPSYKLRLMGLPDTHGAAGGTWSACGSCSCTLGGPLCGP